MKLVDMKMSEEEKAEMMGCRPCDPVMPDYPYGLKLSLCEEQISKLGISGVPAVGETMTIQAVVKVVSSGAREAQEADETQKRNLDLQIIELGMDAKRPASKIAKEMYGE